jgi:hypothetical protein
VREQSVFDNLAAWVAHDPANLDLDEAIMCGFVEDRAADPNWPLSISQFGRENIDPGLVLRRTRCRQSTVSFDEAGERDLEVADTLGGLTNRPKQPTAGSY